MSIFLLFNNLHFSLEIVGFLVFSIVAWLALDAFFIRKDFTALSRFIGFALLALYQILHAIDIDSDVWQFITFGIYLAGIIFVLWNLTLEAPTERPEFKAILVVPAVGPLLVPFNIIITVGLFLIALLSFNQYIKEFKKAILPFWIAFFALALSTLSSIFYRGEPLAPMWIAGHIFEFVGFFALGFWVWSYLKLRVREEMLLIFVSSTLFMAVVVSLTFSTILINRIEVETKENLETNARVLDLTITKLHDEALAKTKFLSQNVGFAQALSDNNFVQLDVFAKQFLKEEKLGFVTFLDKEGGVILRANVPSKKGEKLKGEQSVREAQGGNYFVTLGSSDTEGFSVRAAAPVFDQGEVVGIVLAGFQLDNLYVDSIKDITGLDMSIYEQDIRVATTLFNPDGRSRSVGVTLTDEKVLNSTLSRGNALTLQTSILSRPFLASYLPLYDAAGNSVGLIAATKPQTDILSTAQTTNRFTLIIVVIIMLILITPMYLITRRLGKEVH